ncbi:MAG: hypothetical protein AB1726_02575 [Planctomycetota bacterium]
MRGAPEPDPRWSDWRAAEEDVLLGGERGGPGAAEAAARLSPRAARIRRAMGALELGLRAPIDPLARELLSEGELDLACLLRLALLPPAEIDPSEIRRRAKVLGVANGPGLPVLDLLRLFAAARARSPRSPGSRPASLAKASRARPALRALLPLLSPKFTLYEEGPLLEALSPRLRAYWTVAAAWAARHSDPRALLRERFPAAPASFPAAHWPDLGQAEADGALERWLAARLPPPWGFAEEAAATRLLATSRERRRRVLGTLLARIGTILAEGRPAEAIGAVEAAQALVDSLEGLAGRREIWTQLAVLRQRLAWWAAGEGKPPALAAALWTAMREAPSGERRAVARAALEPGGAPQALPPRLRAEMQIELASAENASEDETVAILLEAARSLPRLAFEERLASSGDPAWGELVRGVHEVGSGDAAAALRRAAALFAQPGGAPRASRLAALALQHGTDPRHRPSRRLRRTFVALLEAVVERDISIGLAVLLPAMATHYLEPKEIRPALDRLGPTLQRALDAPRGPGDAEVADELLLACLLGAEERGRARLREIGRDLRRRASDPAAWRHALLLAAKLSTPPPPRPALARSALEQITAFLLHRGADALEGMARAWCAARPDLAPFLARWAEEHREALGEGFLAEEEDEDEGLAGIEEILAGFQDGSLDFADVERAIGALFEAEDDG